MTLLLIFRNPFMLRARTTTIAALRARALIAAILMAPGSSAGGRAVAEEPTAYIVEVQTS
jgi:hypothetical protein